MCADGLERTIMIEMRRITDIQYSSKFDLASRLQAIHGHFYYMKLYYIVSDGSNNLNVRVNRQLLPQFDDNIERVLGIILLYQFVLNSSFNQVQQAQCSEIYSADLLAHYLATTWFETGT